MSSINGILMVYIFPVQLAIGLVGNVINLVVLLNRYLCNVKNLYHTLVECGLKRIFYLLWLLFPIFYFYVM